MNNLSRIGALGFSHSGTQLGNAKLVSRVAMAVVAGVFALFAGGRCAMGATPPAANPSREIAVAKTKKEAARLAKLQPLISEQMKLGNTAADEDQWDEASKAAAKVLKTDPDHAGAQELKRRVFWGPLPEKTSGNLKYKEHPFDATCAISGVVGEKGAVPPDLPTQFEGRAVVRIGHDAFESCMSLKSVTIPSSVISIGDKAFEFCYYLKSVTISSGVTHLGVGTFAYCRKLASISVATGNPSYQAEGGVLFTKGGKTLVQYPQAKPGESYTISPSVTRIGDSAFSGCQSLTSVTIPSSVTSIGDKGFYGCEVLASVTIPSSVTRIGDMAFAICWKLADLSVAAGNPAYQVEDGVLFTKGGKTLVRYPMGKSGKSYTIPPSVTCIRDNAFVYVRGLESVTIPESVTSIGEWAFAYCRDLKSVTIPSGVASIEDRAFFLCSGLKSVTIPPSVTSIGNQTFYSCSGLKSVTIPSSVTSIGEAAFEGCKGLESVTLPKGVKIGEKAFQRCPWKPTK